MSLSLLQNIYLFKTLSEKELSAVSTLGEVQHYNVGSTIFVKGEPAKALYVIRYGSVRIQQSATNGDNLTVSVLSAGSHFGEMAFVDGEPRSATAEAAETTELVAIPYEKLADFLRVNSSVAVKVYRELAAFLSGRLRVTTSDLNFAREKNLSHF